MDFNLNTLLNLPNVTVFNYLKELEFIILNLNLINEGITCPYCNNYTDIVHQTRPILVRDLSIFGRLVYLKVTRRQFYCCECKKSPTELFAWLNNHQKQTNRYQE
jgi:transposase